MKTFFATALIFSALVFAGCDTLDDAASGVRERFSPRESTRSKTFSSPPRVVYEAVKLAASNMGYRQTSGGPAQGEFAAVNDVSVGDTTGTARQQTMKVRMHGGLDGASTDVGVRFTEILETASGSGRGMGTETTMKDTPLYEVFFRNVQLALDARSTAAPVK
jgi:hypothetical protein